jgi:hypothetical protein
MHTKKAQAAEAASRSKSLVKVVQYGHRERSLVELSESGGPLVLSVDETIQARRIEQAARARQRLASDRL